VEELFDYTCNPNMAWITVNRACNFRCKWCYGESSNYRSEDSMSLELACELVDIGMEAGATHFNIIGGEPTIWQHLFDLFTYCREKGATCGLITNASRFGDDEYWERYQQNPCDRISISVKSTDPEQFELVTNSTAYNKTIKGIERAVKFHKTGVTTAYNSLVGMSGLKDIAVKCKDLGASAIIVNMCSPILDEYGGVKKGYSIDYGQISKDTMEMVQYLEKIYGENTEIDIQTPLCLFPEDFIEEYLGANRIMTMCQVFARSGINFNNNGDVIVCNELMNGVIAKKGIDFLDGKSLLAHLNSRELKNQYRELLRYPAECCTDCRWKDNCRGGCLMNWFILDPAICHAV